MYRCIATWTGWTGAPGYTVMHFDPAGLHTQANAVEALYRVRTFFDVLSELLPDLVTIAFQSTVDQIDPENGQLVTSFSVTPAPGVIPGDGAPEMAAAAGACITWRTPAVVNGKRLRGRTFLVPLAVGCYANDGTLTDGALNILGLAATGLIADNPIAPPRLAIWHRPVNGAGGSVGIANAFSVADKSAVLTSRRD